METKTPFCINESTCNNGVTVVSGVFYMVHAEVIQQGQLDKQVESTVMARKS
jgi:hypothetical protein